MKVDTRAGSRELIEPLKRLGVVVDETILPAGDFEIIGNGPEGRPVLVGVEYKTVSDVAACMRNGRFADQMRGMKSNYEVSWLLVEGRIGSIDSNISIHKTSGWFTLPQRVKYPELAAWLHSMSMVAGVMLWRTETKAESALWLRTLDRWWTVKEWEQHRSTLDYYTPPINGNPFQEPSLALKVAATLPHIGSVKAERVANYFGSVKKMACATKEDWVKISGVGKKVAKDIVDAIERES